MRFSRIQLPGSSILLKSALNKEGFKYYKRFTKDTTVSTEVIESFETPIKHDFLQGATEIILDDSLQNEEDNKDIKNAIILLHGYGGDGKDISMLTLNWKRHMPNTIFVCPNKYTTKPKYPCHFIIDSPVFVLVIYLLIPTIT